MGAVLSNAEEFHLAAKAKKPFRQIEDHALYTSFAGKGGKNGDVESMIEHNC